MPVTHKNRLRTTISNTPGAAGALTISTASSGYRTFAAGDNGLTFDVVITDGTAWEVRTDCTYTHSGTSLSRGTLEDSSTGSAITLTSAAVVTVTATAGWGSRVISGAKNVFQVGSDYFIQNADDVTNGTQACVANTIYVQSFLLPISATVSGLAINVTTLGAGNVRAGVYSMNADKTASLLAEIASPFDVSSTGAKSQSFSSNLWLLPGYYIIAHVSDIAWTARANTSGVGILGGQFINGSAGAVSDALTYPSGMPSTILNTDFATNAFLTNRVRFMMVGV